MLKLVNNIIIELNKTENKNLRKGDTSKGLGYNQSNTNKTLKPIHAAVTNINES